MKTNTPNNHFYASSVATWATTTPERDLRELIALMDAEGFDYNLFFIPHPHDTPYEIRMYQPQIEGAQWCGMFSPNKKTRKQRAAA